MRNTVLTLGLVLCACTPARAQAWTEYELDLGNGYELFCNNDTDVGILRKNPGGPFDSYLIPPDSSSGVGPIIEYAVTTKYIFTHNAGLASRNLFQGDTFEDPDYSKNYYFFIDVVTSQVSGPLTLAQFNLQPPVVALSPIKWSIPQNPYFRWVCALIGFGAVSLVAIVIALMRRKRWPAS